MSLFPIFAPAAAPAAVLNFVGFTASGSSGSSLENTTTFSYSSIDVGSNEGADRDILVASVTSGGGAGTDGVSGLTCGGDAGTKVFEELATDHQQIVVFKYEIASGTSKDIEVSYQRSSKRGGIYVWEGSDLNFKSSVVETNANGAGSLTHSASRDIEAGQAVIGISILANGETTSSLTFSNVTERTDVALGPGTGTGQQTGCADATFAAASAGQGFSVEYSAQALRTSAFLVFGP